MGVMQVMRSLLMAQPHKESVTGVNGIATFNTNFKAPTKIVIPFNPVQEGSGDPSPENSREITGLSSCSVWNSNVPQEYQLVEYLVATGSQYINTGFVMGLVEKLKATSVFYVDSAYKNTDNPVTWLRRYASTNQGDNQVDYKFPNIYKGNAEVRGYRISDNTVTSISYNTKTRMDFDYSPGSQKVYKNGILVGSWTYAKPTVSVTRALYLMRTNSAGNYYLHGRLYYFNIEVNGVLHEYLPCYRKSDNVIGLYETQTGTFLTNAGSGSFSVGPDVSVNEYQLKQGSVTVDWQSEAGTVYGGVLTLNEDRSADLVATLGARVYDNETNINLTTLAVGYYQLSNIPTRGQWQTPSYCSHYKINGNPGIIGGNNSAFWIRGYDYTDINGFRDFLRQQAQNGTPLCVVWELATPQTYHFDNVGQLKSFIGQNNVWTDLSGDPTVGYWKHG